VLTWPTRPGWVKWLWHCAGMECGGGAGTRAPRAMGGGGVLGVVVGGRKRITTWGVAGWIGLGPLVNVLADLGFLPVFP
jgi:hypothetical protein